MPSLRWAGARRDTAEGAASIGAPEKGVGRGERREERGEMREERGERRERR